MSPIRSAFRSLLRSPAYALVAALSLALGIGTATGVFALVHGTMLRSLPVPRPGELRRLTWVGAYGCFTSYSGSLQGEDDKARGDAFSEALVADLGEAAAGQGQVFGFASGGTLNARTGAEPVTAEALLVTRSFFQALEVGPYLGGLPAEPRSVALDYRFWRDRYGSDPQVVGRILVLDGKPFTIAGVLPERFQGPSPEARPAVYLPLEGNQAVQGFFKGNEAGMWWVQAMARVRPGHEAALAAAVDLAFRRQTRRPGIDPHVEVASGRTGPVRADSTTNSTLLLLLGGSSLLVLAACVNLAGLTLTRAAGRRHEQAVQVALGASRARLAGATLLESLLVALVGAVAGLAVALAVRDGLARSLEPRGLVCDVSLSPAVLGFSLAAALAAAAVSGLVPALRAAAADPLDGLRGHALRGHRRPRLGRILVVAQLALSLTLLAGTGLLLRTVQGLRHKDPGFSPRNLVVVRVDPKLGDASGAYHRRALEALAGLPGVERAALSHLPLLGGSRWTSSCRFPGPEGAEVRLDLLKVSEGFFPALGLPLRAGRDFTPADAEGAAPVAIVNEAFVRVHNGGRSPLGLVLAGTRKRFQIIGVCPDLVHADLREDVRPMLVLPFAQNPVDEAAYLLRTQVPAPVLAPLVRKALAAVDPAVPVARIQTQASLLEGQVRKERLLAGVASCMAGFALLLTCLGTYGLIAYDTGRRQGEFGIRSALGASPWSIRTLVLGEALRLAGAGAALGLAGACALTRILSAVLYGVKPTDPGTFAQAAGVLLLVALGAALAPAWRASRADPSESLRAQ